MKWMRLFSVMLWLMPVVSRAQFGSDSDPTWWFIPNGVAAMSPTNLPGGFSAFVWAEPAMGYSTNGGIGTLSNLTSAGAYYDLTNAAATSPARQIGRLNSLDTLDFNGSATLRCANYTNYPPFEIFMVLSTTNISTSWIAGADAQVGSSIGAWAYEINLVNYVADFHGTTSTACRSITNRYFVMDLVFTNSGANAGIYFITNNVVSTSVMGALGALTNAFGMRLGGRPTDGAFKAQYSLACFFAFTNQLLTAAARSNAYYYCTNKFNLAVP